MEKQKGLLIALSGHVLYGASQYLAQGEAELSLLPRGLGIAAAAAMVLGSAYYVRSKGYGPTWGLFGFIPFLGIGTLMLIPPMDSLVDDPTYAPPTAAEAPIETSGGAS